MNYNSTKNQEIKGKLVHREVIYCASTMMYELRETHGYEIMELFSKSDYDQALENFLYDMNDSDKQELLNEYGVESVEELDAKYVVNDHDLDYDYAEVHEYWIVTEWFGEKLKEKGEIVEDFMGFTLWGRQTTGQAILLDGVISRIAEDMEILEGMKYEW